MDDKGNLDGWHTIEHNPRYLTGESLRPIRRIWRGAGYMEVKHYMNLEKALEFIQINFKITAPEQK
jgi:hypothetical protein